MLLPDLMHEFELGVWRAIFIHLLRILQSLSKSLLVELDRRYVDANNANCCRTLSNLIKGIEKFHPLEGTQSDVSQ
jgi:hypothetical protein